MKKAYIYFIVFLLSYHVNAQDADWQWAIHGGGISWDHGYSIAIDQQNNMLIRGKFVATGFFGDTSIYTSLQEEDYLAKYTENGELLWVRKIGGKASWQKDRSIAVDEENNIYLTGYFNSPSDFDQISLAPVGDYDGYVAKLNPAGQYEWAKAIGSTGRDAGYGIAYANGNVLVTGYFCDTVNFEAGNIISKGGSDLYVACYNKAGLETWIVRGGGINNDMGVGLVSDGQTIYVTGNFSGAADFGGINLNGTGTDDLLLAKYDMNGSVIWAVNDGSSGSIESKSIALGSDGIYLTGKFSGSITFGSFNLQATGQSDAYLVKFRTNGIVEWVDLFGGDFANEGNSLAYKNGCIYTTGVFAQTISIGDTTLVCDGLCDSYISCHKSNGEFVWAKKLSASGGNNYFMSNSIIADLNHNIYIGGEYSGEATIGDSNMQAVGSFDMFLAMLKDNTNTTSVHVAKGDDALKVFPNPNNGIFTLTFAGQQSVNIQVYDANGKIVMSRKCTSGETINISDTKPGCYYLRSDLKSQKIQKILYLYN